jgi:predicted nucleotidyltransferase
MEDFKNKLLRYFFEEPEREFYVRELAKLVKKSPTTISKYLNALEKEKLLVSSKKFNHLLFKADVNRKFKNLKLNHNLSLIRNSGLLDYLNDIFNYPEAIVLFGSFARAENIKKSDIDILIVSPSKKKPILKTFEKKLEHEIQLFVYSEKELSSLKNKELLNNFINGVVLEGYIEVVK